VEFLVFLLLLIWFIRWNKRRRQRRAANAYSPPPSTHHSPSEISVTPLWQSNPQAPAPSSSASDGWFRDPTGRYASRYWSGQHWTEWVSTADHQVRSDPIVTNIPMPGVNRAPSNVAPPRYRAPEPGSQVDGPDLNELRRRFNN
jgi:hypothetical protein